MIKPPIPIAIRMGGFNIIFLWFLVFSKTSEKRLFYSLPVLKAGVIKDSKTGLEWSDITHLLLIRLTLQIEVSKYLMALFYLPPTPCRICFKK